MRERETLYKAAVAYETYQLEVRATAPMTSVGKNDRRADTSGGGRERAKHTRTPLYNGLLNALIQNCVERKTARATVHNGVAEHSTPMDERAFAVPASERHHLFVFAYYMFSLSLSLSSDTWDGGARPAATMSAHPGVLLGADDCTL